MAELSKLPLKYRLPLALYRWRVLDPTPLVTMGKPLTEARVAIATSAGLYLAGRDPPFESRRGGDPSVRWIDADTEPSSLAIGQTSEAFDRTPLERDRNEGFPIEPLREIVAAGGIGSIAREHPSFNGSMTAPGRFTRDTAPTIAATLSRNQVDAVLLVPV
ncbi:MAG: glycine/sarcosine/betaine reductase selenoprotein B family protein [Gemmatimonadota bacterium]